jgi:hypothetical protein
MLREQFWLTDTQLREISLKHGYDAAMKLLTRAAQQCAVRRIPHQSVFE